MGDYTTEDLQNIFIMQGFSGISLFSVLLLMGLGLHYQQSFAYQPNNGTPFLNDLHERLEAGRDAGSPASLPVYEEGRTVRFADGLATLCSDASRVFLEVGPGQTLSAVARISRASPACSRSGKSLVAPKITSASVMAFCHAGSSEKSRAAVTPAVRRVWGVAMG